MSEFLVRQTQKKLHTTATLNASAAASFFPLLAQIKMSVNFATIAKCLTIP